jgi:hypothetical protein
MLIRAATAIAVLLWVAGCAASERITEGVYVSANGGTLTVKRDYIDIDIPATDKRADRGGARCFYEVQPDGSLKLYGSSNSSYFLFAVQEWDWHWTGMEFQTKHLRDGTVVTYTRQKQRPY